MTALLVGTGALASGCTGGGEPRGARRRPQDPEQTPETDPDVALALVAVAGERAVLDAVAATMGRYPDLAAGLSTAHAVHQAHVRLLDRAVPDEAGGASPSGTASSGQQRPPGRRNRFEVAERAQTALRQLSSLEEQLSLANQRHAVAARSGTFARMLASMAASASQQASVLRQPAGTAPGRR